MMRRPNQRLQIRLENHARPLANRLPAHLIINSDLDVWRVANRLCQRRPRSDTNAFEVINGNRSFANWISALVAIGAASLALEAIRRQTRTQSWIANHDLLKRTTDMIEAEPKLLEIFGIDIKQLEQDDLTAKELVFINTQLDASSVYYRISGEKPVFTEYRKNFLRHPKVRLAWRKYLRERTQNPGPWMDAVDAYIKEVEAGETRHSN
jgi:hypothetical protein